MGFFDKIFKGVKKVFKKIGKGIKSAFKSVGRFMGKIGIVGQIALGLLLPGIGTMIGTWAGAAMGSANAFVSAAGHFVNAAVQIGTKAGTVFKTVTQGVTNVIGETVGAVLNKIPGMDGVVQKFTGSLGMNAGKGIDISQKGFGSIMDVATQAVSDVAKTGGNLFSMDTLTGTNKYAIGKLAPKATDFDIKRGDGIADNVRSAADDATNAFTGTSPADLADNARIAADNATNAFTGTSPADLSDSVRSAADNATNAFTGTSPADLSDSVRSAADNATNAFTEISKPDLNTVADSVVDVVDTSPKSLLSKKVTEGYDYLKDRASNIIPDTVDDFVGSVTNAPSTYIKGKLGPQAGDMIVNKAAIPDLLNISSEIRTGRGMEFDPMAYSANTDFFNLNPYGNSALQRFQHQQQLNEKLNYSQGMR